MKIERLTVVDALRGFAIASILLLHNLEHFDFYYTPANIPLWLQSVDKAIWDAMFFLFSGKSFAIFALLFGLTFYIQSNNQQLKGKQFTGRFAWRMTLLLGFGLVNSAFFQGDILMIYALIGLFLIPLSKLNQKAVLVVAILLLLQPLELAHLLYAWQNPGLLAKDPASWAYFGKMGAYITSNSLWDTWLGNLTNGKIAVLLWNYENGRFFQILALFLLGMLLGKRGAFSASAQNKLFWQKVLVVAALLFIPLYFAQKNLGQAIANPGVYQSVSIILSSWANLAFMFVLVSGFWLLFQTKAFASVLGVFAAMGKMSMTNYVLQSVIGACIYYGFGLGLYKYTCPTYSFVIGLVLLALTNWFCRYWAKKHRFGPLEGVWHHLTWIGSEESKT